MSESHVVISRKRSLSIDLIEQFEPNKRNKQDSSNILLTELTTILAEIKSTPSSGEISAELLSSLRLLMLQIESLSADESNTEAKNTKDESDKCLDEWFQDLVAQCEADGGFDSSSNNCDSDNEQVEDLALALALQDEEDYFQEQVVVVVTPKKEEQEEQDDDVDII